MIDIKRLFLSFSYAIEGIRYGFSHDQNLRIHLLAGTLVIAASIFFNVSVFEMTILGMVILLVLVVEMVNTAIEQMVDLISQEHRKEARIAKDVSAGMVLFTAIGSVIVGGLIFIPRIMAMFWY